MYCSCGKEATGVWYDLTGQTNKLQVHPTCRKPHRAYFERFTAMRCPRGAQALIHIRSRRDGINEITFACDGGERKMVEVLSTQPEVVLDMWKMLDDAVNSIKESSGNEDYNKGHARAIAECISTCMSTHYPTSDDVVREALARFNDPNRETPGLAEEVYAPPQPALKKAEVKRTGNLIPDTAVGMAKQGIEQKMFTVKQMADSYSMTETEVKEQLGLV